MDDNLFKDYLVRIDGKMRTEDLGFKIYYAFFQGVLVLWERGLYISAMKLLLCSIDTVTFLKYTKNTGKEFQEWLNDYVDLVPVGITAEELWEHRNALLHMTTLHSNAIQKGKVNYLSPCKDGADPAPPVLKNIITAAMKKDTATNSNIILWTS